MEDWEEVESIEDCIEMATTDTYGDSEQLWAWYTCLNDIFSGTEKVKVFGEIVKFQKVVVEGMSILAFCEKNKKKAKVSLDSLELIKPTKSLALWIKAWKKWSENLG